MSSNRPAFTDIDTYIASFPPDVQAILRELRAAIRAAAPDAEEAFSYAIPTFRMHGNLVHFAAFKNHVGFYPGPSGMEHFKEDFSAYKHAKGSVQYPLGQPLPLDLVRRVVAFRVAENQAAAARKNAGRKDAR